MGLALAHVVLVAAGFALGGLTLRGDGLGTTQAPSGPIRVVVAGSHTGEAGAPGQHAGSSLCAHMV